MRWIPLLFLAALGCAEPDDDENAPLLPEADGAAAPDAGEPDAEPPRDAEADIRRIRVSSDFESGNIGRTRQQTDDRLELWMRDDNDDGSLPDNWRSWWFVRLDDVRAGEPLEIAVHNRGWDTVYSPVYSYDGATWLRMEDRRLDFPAGSVLMRAEFEEPTVWLARFYPYTPTTLDAYLAGLDASPYVTREAVGETQQGRRIQRVTITDRDAPREGKVRVMLHGRTHPAETGSSFVVEGLVDFLLSGEPDAQTALRRFVVDIVPMHNVDGVAVGNYRTTPQSENLEDAWFYEEGDPYQLGPRAPLEVHALRDAYAERLEEPDALPVTVAINLHSSNGEPSRPAFFFPHFGPEELGYGEDEARLWHDQVAFIEAVEERYGAGLIDDIPAEGGGSFADRHYPETWWWLNRGPEVMAITLETVYGRAGFDHWVEPDDMRDLGHAVGRALLDYHDRE